MSSSLPASSASGSHDPLRRRRIIGRCIVAAFGLAIAIGIGLLAPRMAPVRSGNSHSESAPSGDEGLSTINIYVGNLPYTTTESDLRQLFGQYGNVLKTSVIIDRETGRSRGFGFVEMSNGEEGRRAIEELNGRDYDNRPLTVNKARQPATRNPDSVSRGRDQEKE